MSAAESTTRLYASRKALLRAGWKPTERKLVPLVCWPAGDRIVYERGEEGLEHVYSVYDDYSDYPDEDRSVAWRRVKFQPEELFQVVARTLEEKL